MAGETMNDNLTLAERQAAADQNMAPRADRIIWHNGVGVSRQAAIEMETAGAPIPVHIGELLDRDDNNRQ